MPSNTDNLVMVSSLRWAVVSAASFGSSFAISILSSDQRQGGRLEDPREVCGEMSPVTMGRERIAADDEECDSLIARKYTSSNLAIEHEVLN